MIKVNGVEVIQNNFPDGTLCTRASEDKHQDIYCFDWKYENDAELFTLICLRKHYGNKKAVLYMPYCPHARMDRVKNDADVFTLKYFAEVINSLNFDQVIICDPHSNVTPALINNCVIEEPKIAIKRAIEESEAEAVCYPDEGAMKRYSAMSPLPYAFCIKKREWETGKILGLDLQNPEAIVGKNVLIIDDICSRGGTFFYTAKALKKAGAKSVSLYVTHLENTVLEGDLYTAMAEENLINHIYTTDSIWNSQNPYISMVNNI